MKRITLFVVAILLIGSISAWADQFNFGLSLSNADPSSVTILGGINASFGFFDFPSYPNGLFFVNASGGTITWSAQGGGPSGGSCTRGCPQVDGTFSGVDLTITSGALPSDQPFSGTVLIGSLSGTEGLLYGGQSLFNTSVSGSFTITSVSPEYLAAIGFQGTPTAWGGSGTVTGFQGVDGQFSMGNLDVDLSGFAVAADPPPDPAPEPGTLILFAFGIIVMTVGWRTGLGRRRFAHRP